MGRCYPATPWMQYELGLLTAAERDDPDARTEIVHRGHFGRPCDAGVTRRLDLFAGAIIAIEKRGEKPTSRAVLREIGLGPYLQDNGYGTVIDNGMGGRDLRIFEMAMQEAGYRRGTPIPEKPWYHRWEKAS